MNYGGPTSCRTFLTAEMYPTEAPFRSLFQCRYYVIDFEFSVRFPASTSTQDRVFGGFPYARTWGPFDPSEYGKVGRGVDLGFELVADIPS